METYELREKVIKLEEKVSELKKLQSELEDLKKTFNLRLRRNNINTKKIIDEYLLRKKQEFGEFQRDLMDKDDMLKKEREFLEKQKKQDKDALEKIFKEKSLGFPWLATAYGDYLELRDEQLANYLEKKSHPTLKSADVVRLVKKEKKEHEKKFRVASSLLEYYENLFPWLIDLRGEDLDDLIEQTLQKEESKEEFYTKEDIDSARKWLTEAEYEKLPTTEKYQLALDRYWQKKKTSWEIGRDYERYIGYLYESKGYQVYYQGIVKGYEDLGRDLICTKDGYTEVIQCKYWSQDKTIHEKHINQLFGTTVMFWIEKLGSKQPQLEPSLDFLKSKKVIPRFVTSTQLSDTARQFANTLGVKVKENFPLSPYPSVKCNLSRKTDEKIYHLPFDQQYDRTVIEEERNECYTETVAEAERKGHRRAFRWRG